MCQNNVKSVFCLVISRMPFRLRLDTGTLDTERRDDPFYLSAWHQPFTIPKLSLKQIYISTYYLGIYFLRNSAQIWQWSSDLASILSYSKIFEPAFSGWFVCWSGHSPNLSLLSSANLLGAAGNRNWLVATSARDLGSFLDEFGSRDS